MEAIEKDLIVTEERKWPLIESKGRIHITNPKFWDKALRFNDVIAVLS